MNHTEILHAVDAVTGAATFTEPGQSPDTPITLSGAVLSRHLKRALTKAFPGVKFSVKGSRGTGYGWFSVRWENGPKCREIDAITFRYQYEQFNGMIDGYDLTKNLAWHEDGVWVRGGARGINTERKLTHDFVLAAITPVAQRRGWTMPTGDYNKGDWYHCIPYPSAVRHEENWQSLAWRILQRPEDYA